MISNNLDSVYFFSMSSLVQIFFVLRFFFSLLSDDSTH